MSSRSGALPFVERVRPAPLIERSLRPKQVHTARDFLRDRWRFCAGFSVAITLVIAIRLIDALPGPAWSTLTRSLVEIWLMQWLPAALAVGVSIGLLDQWVRRPWQRVMGALALVMFFAIASLLYQHSALAILGQYIGFVPLGDEIAADRASFYLGQMTIGAIYFALLAGFYLKVQDAQCAGAALSTAQLNGLRMTRAVAQSRLSSIQAHVDPDFLFAALSHVQAEYQRDAVQAQAALDEVITFLRSALPRRHAEDRAFREEIALAESYLRLAGLIEDRTFALRTSFADSASEAAAFPPHICLPLVRAMALILAPDQSMHLSGRVVQSRLQVTLVMPLTNPNANASASLSIAVSAAKQSLAAIHGADATLLDYIAQQHFHINIEVPYAPCADR